MTRPNIEETNWGTDTPISLPVPAQDDVLIDFGAFGMTRYGIAHNITTGDIGDYLPVYLPVNDNG